jgi:hypothetical protein
MPENSRWDLIQGLKGLDVVHDKCPHRSTEKELLLVVVIPPHQFLFLCGIYCVNCILHGTPGTLSFWW